ncbi:MAG: serine hydrolase domain-containing protein [Shimia sp.]
MRHTLASLLLVLVLAGPALAHPTQIVWYQERDGVVRIAAKGGADARTVFPLASVGKLMTAVAAMRLVERGVLDLDTPVSGRVPPAAVDAWPQLRRTSLRHLLTMTAGLPDYYGRPYVRAALSDPARVQRAEVALSYAYDDETLFDPGDGFDYSNTNYLLAGMIVADALGTTYAEAMRREVFGPAGMADSFVYGSRALPPGFATGHQDRRGGLGHVRDYYAHDGFGDGGVAASAADLAAFYRALFLERRLLGAAALRILTEDPLGEYYGMGVVVDETGWGHAGGDLGVATDVWLDRDTGEIAIVLAGDEDHDLDAGPPDGALR